MCKFNMFITAVCVLFLVKLRWPKNKSIYDKHKDIRKRSIKHKHKAVMVGPPCTYAYAYLILVFTWHKCDISTCIGTRRTGRVRSSCAYAYVVGVLTCFSAAYAYACVHALAKTIVRCTRGQNVIPTGFFILIFGNKAILTKSSTLISKIIVDKLNSCVKVVFWGI